ncbi:hypothetical protein AXG93_815s1210 [Marchantia polymorpha subsp. ruderalis]|uniref:Uncharacterized protein n=1 Tax=Marchantia polymorpha subsp. ruderalis TaxID=1480154 RepID=A0A176W090_MARPO|nr:hypothetical protein AXG93_815s1210 [Marchantia polymorpha subsp. ruderalis]
MAPPKTNDRVRKLVPLKVPYEELRPYRRELSELHLDFLLWNWNCISASICKEIMDKNRNDESLANHLTSYLVNFYRGMELLTKEEKKRFPNQREVLAVESNEENKEENNSRPRIPPQTTARRPVQVDDLPTRERQELRLAKRRKVVTDDEEDLMLESRMAEAKIVVVWQSRTQARPKKKASRKLVVTKSSDSSVMKTIVAAIATVEDASVEPTQQVVEGEPSATRSVGSEDVIQPKSGEELAKEFTLTEAILKQIVAEVGGTVENITEYLEPPPPEEELRSKRKIAEAKTAKEEFCSTIVELTNERDKEFKRAEELTTNLAEEIRKHVEKLTDWAKKLADCESARSLAVECRLKGESEQQRLQEQLGKVVMRSKESQSRMEKSEAAYRHLRDETSDELRSACADLQCGDCNW